jgi:hypothetical protein
MTTDFDNLDEFDDLIDEIKAAGDVPEPSPLFWHHLSARVRDAVSAEPAPGPRWMAYWRPVLAAAGTVAVVATVVLLQPDRALTPVGTAASAARVSAAAQADVEVSEMWRMIEVASPAMALDSVQEAGLMPSAYATDQAIRSLTPSQREELARMLRKELGVSE